MMLKDVDPRRQRDDSDAEPGHLKPTGVLQGCREDGGCLSAPGAWAYPGLIAAPITCLTPPPLPKVTALQGWARHLCSSCPPAL